LGEEFVGAEEPWAERELREDFVGGDVSGRASGGCEQGGIGREERRRGNGKR
jgi:hypothetical protein